MGKVFEDAFMDIQAGIIGLCREATKDCVDRIYAYCMIDGRSYSFNAFFTVKGKAVFLSDLGVPADTHRLFLTLGTQDTKKIKKVCEEYGKPVPTEIKMIYDVKTREFTADYQYKPVRTMDVGFPDLFMGWINEIDPTYK